MISGRAALASMIAHVVFAGWVVSAKPAPENVVEDAEAAPAIEVLFELEPVVTQETAESAADIAMATEQPAVVQRFVPDLIPEPVQQEEKAEDKQIPVSPHLKAADIELPPLPELEPLQTSDIAPPAEAAPPVPTIEAPEEVVASVSPVAAAVADAEKPSPEQQPEAVETPQLQKPKPTLQAEPEKQKKPEIKAPPKRVAKDAPFQKPEKPVTKKKAVKAAKLIKGKAPVAKLAGGKSKALASKKALAAAAGRKAVASGGSAIDPGYKSRILAKLRGAKRAPKGGGSGRVVLAFTVSRSGGLLSARIVKSGGHPALDQATLAMARSAAPFPAMPASMKRTSMSFTVPVQYN